MTPDYILLGDWLNVKDVTVSTAWQFAPGPNTGLWGLTNLQVGSIEFYNGFDIEGGPIIQESWHPVKIRGTVPATGPRSRSGSTRPTMLFRAGQCHRSRQERSRERQWRKRQA
jgi:hypothetical protein